MPSALSRSSVSDVGLNKTLPGGPLVTPSSASGQVEYASTTAAVPATLQSPDTATTDEGGRLSLTLSSSDLSATSPNGRLPQNGNFATSSTVGSLPSPHQPRSHGHALLEEKRQRTELLALIGRLNALVVPATERVLRVGNALKMLRELVFAFSSPAAVIDAPSCNSMSLASAWEAAPPSMRLCVTGALEADIEDVFHFVVHRDPPALPQPRGSASAGGSAMGRRSAAFSNTSTPGARPPTPDTGPMSSASVPAAALTPQRWSRVEASGGGPTSSTAAPCIALACPSVRDAAPTHNPVDREEAPNAFSQTPPPQVRPVAAPPLSLESAPVAGGSSGEPASSKLNILQPTLTASTKTDLLLPSRFQRPVSLSQRSSEHALSGIRSFGTTSEGDANCASPHLPQLTSALPPMPSPKASTGTPGVSAGFTSQPFPAAHHSQHHVRTLSPLPLLPSSAAPPSIISTAATPPLIPAAPTNPRLRSFRTGGPVRPLTVVDAQPVTSFSDGEALSEVSPAPPVASMITDQATTAMEEVTELEISPLASLSSTMPELSATPPPSAPLPSENAVETTPEANGELAHTATHQTITFPITTALMSLTSPPKPYAAPVAMINFMGEDIDEVSTVGIGNSRWNHSSGLAQTMPLSPANASPISPTPIMINGNPQRAFSQYSEATESHLQQPGSLHCSSTSPGAARFITLPTPFNLRGRLSVPGSAGRSLRDDSIMLSRASSFTPPTRFAQRVRRRTHTISLQQLRSSAWNLFPLSSFPPRDGALLPATHYCLSSLANTAKSPERNPRQMRPVVSGHVSAGGSRLGSSQHHDDQPLNCATHSASDPPPSLLSPHTASATQQWLVSLNEDGILRYEALPPVAQPPPYMQAPPITITADFFLVCLPYNAVAQGAVQDESEGNCSGRLSENAGLPPCSLSDEAAAALEAFFGIFHDSKQPQHNAHLRTSSAPAAADVGSSGASAVAPAMSGFPVRRHSTAHSTIPPQKSSARRSEKEAVVRTQRRRRRTTDSFPANPPMIPFSDAHVPNSAVAAAQVRQEEGSNDSSSMSSAGPRISTAGTTTPGDLPFAPPTQRLLKSASNGHDGDRCHIRDTLSPPSQSALELTAVGIQSRGDWLRPLRQALVDRAFFLLVRSDVPESPSPNHRHTSASVASAKGTGSAEDSAEEWVSRQFISLMAARFAVTVPLWRVIVFSHRDAVRARNLMLALYAQRVRQAQQTAESLSPGLVSTGVTGDALTPIAATAVSLPRQPPRDNGNPASESSALSPTALLTKLSSPPRRVSVVPLDGTFTPAVGTNIGSLGGMGSPPGTSLTSSSRLTYGSFFGGADRFRSRGDDLLSTNGSEEEAAMSPQHPQYSISSDALYTLLTQDFTVPSLAQAMQQYRPFQNRSHAADWFSTLCSVRWLSVSSARRTTGGSFRSLNGPEASATEEMAASPVAAAGEGSCSGQDRLKGSKTTPQWLNDGPPGSAEEVLGETEASVTAETALVHAHEVLWYTSGAARLSGAYRFFEHAAMTHRIARAALAVMMWTWQLHTLLPFILKDMEARRSKLQHQRHRSSQKLNGVSQSIAQHLASSPAKRMAALEVRLHHGFRDMTRRFLQDVRHLFLLVGNIDSSTAISPTSTSTRTAPPHFSVDALQAYDSPDLRDAYQRLARAMQAFNAFYLAGQMSRKEREGMRFFIEDAPFRRDDASPERGMPISLYEQQYIALHHAAAAASRGLGLVRRASGGVIALPSGGVNTPRGSHSAAQQSSPAAGTAFPLIAIAPTSSTESDAAVSARRTTEELDTCEMQPMPKVVVMDEARPLPPFRISPATPPSGVSTGSLLMTGGSSLADAAVSQTRLSSKASGGQLKPRLQSSSSSPSQLASAAKSNKTAVRDERSSTLPFPSAAARSSDRERVDASMEAKPCSEDTGVQRWSLNELIKQQATMEHDLIARVSQINTEMINFFLATCVAAIPHLQRECVNAELERVKKTQMEIVLNFTKAAHGHKEAAMAASQLCSHLEEWSTDLSQLVSMVRSRAYLERFITQLRAVLCEDEVRGLAAFRGRHWKRRVSPGEAAEGGTSAERETAFAETMSSRPLSSTALATEVGHRSVRMLRYYTLLRSHRPKGNSGSGQDLDLRAAVGSPMRRDFSSGVMAARSQQRSTYPLGYTAPSSSNTVRRQSRVAATGTEGGDALLSPISLSCMSAAWNREEERFDGEGAKRSRDRPICGSADNATPPPAFFASRHQPGMAAVLSDVLAVLEDKKSRGSEDVSRKGASTPPQRSSLVHSPRSTLPPVDPATTSAAAAADSVGLKARTAGSDSHSSGALDDGGTGHRVEQTVEETSRVDSQDDADPSAAESTWQQELTAWRSKMIEAERPRDAEGAPLFWIMLDAWDETLLRMPYGLLIDVDTARYADFLNRLSSELISSQHEWQTRCEVSLVNFNKQLKALESDRQKLCDESGELRAAYVKELQSIFDDASHLVVMHDDAFHEHLCVA